MNQPSNQESKFSPYDVFVITVLAFIQFTVVLDFMVLSPLGAILLDELSLDTSQFGLVVSAYAFSAGASGLLAAGFADKFDRTKLLLFVYTGFIIGTFFCAIAPGYLSLLAARIITGLFGGVMSSISFAIVTDLFVVQMRGRVMGFVQMAFAVSQVAGIPVGLYLANNFGWHAPFWMIAILGIIAWVIIFLKLKPITGHLVADVVYNPIQHFVGVFVNRQYVFAFLATTILATGGFMLMPFGTTFTTNNMGISLEDLPIIYAITGVFSMVFGPLVGYLSDKIGKYKMFLFGSFITIIIVAIFTSRGITPIQWVIVLNVIMFAGISSRMISAGAMFTAIPKPADRGAFMSVNSSIQQISGGIAAWIAGLIVVQQADKTLLHYDILGYVVIGSMTVGIVLIYFVNRRLKEV